MTRQTGGMELLIVFVALLLLDVAALRWGYDSRRLDERAASRAETGSGFFGSSFASD